MNRHSSKSNMWKNISTVIGKWESPHPNKEILCQNQSHRAYHELLMKQPAPQYRTHKLYLAVIQIDIIRPTMPSIY